MTLGSLEGTPISTPSGYRISTGPVRTDQTVDFEFAYNVRQLDDGSYQRVFLPRAALGLTSTNQADPGLQRRERELRRHHQRAQQRVRGRFRRPGRSWASDTWSARAWSAAIGVPLYGKLQILSFQDSTVTFQVLTDQNCGFKDLLPGLPKN